MKLKSPIFLLATILILLLSVVSGLPAFAAGTNVANVTEYGLYNYVDSNTASPSPIGTVLTTGNDGATYNPPPWISLTGVPYVFSSDVRIGIKFAVNVIPDTYWSANQACFHMYDSANNPVSINVTRAGDGSSSDINRDYIFVAPQGPLKPLTTYKIIIDATITSNNGNQAGKQQEVDFTTVADTTVPTWPVGSELTCDSVTPTSLTLSWPAATDNVAVTGYCIYQGATLLQSLSAATCSYSFTGLIPNTNYAFTVQAVDAAGNLSTEGPTTSVTTANDTQAPVWPAEATLSISNPSDTGLTLSWPAATDNLAVAGYKVYQDAVLIQTVSATTYSYSVTGLTAGTTYSFTVQAFDEAGNLSAGGPSITVKNGAPVNPGNVSLTLSPGIVAAGGDVTASGTAPISTWISLKVLDSNQGVVYFDAVKSDAGGNYSLPFKAPNVNYGNFSVITGYGNDIAVSNLTVDSLVPTWTAGSTLTSENVTSTGLTLTWTAATDSTGVTGYNVYQDGALLTTTPIGETSYSVTGLTSDTTYTFKVEAGDAVGNWSTDGPVNVTATTPPDTTVPTWTNGSLSTSGVTETSLILTWSGAFDNVRVTGYKVYQGTSLLNSTPVTGDTYTVNGLTSGNRYTFKVEAGDADGNWSSTGPGYAVFLLPGDASGTVTITDADCNVSTLLNAPVSGSVTTAPLPEVKLITNTSLNVSPMQVDMPAGVTVTAPEAWDGTIHAPVVQAADSVTIPGATVNAVIEIGYGDLALTFNQPVRILIPGQAGKSVGYYRNGAFTKINKISDDSAAALGANDDGYLNVDTDLIVWTRHFTQFVTYTKSDPGGGSSDTTPPDWPNKTFITAAKAGSEVTLEWHAAHDSSGITSYKIFMDGEYKDKVNGGTTKWIDSNITGPHTFKVEAVDNHNNESADGPSVYITGSGDNPLNYVSANLTTITGFTSSDGEEVEGNTSVPFKPTIRIVFDRNITADTIWPANKQCFAMQDSDDKKTSISVTKISNDDNFDERRHVFITPASSLTQGKIYKIIVSKNLEANNGNTLGSNVTITFSVAGGTTASGGGGGGIIANPNAPTYTTGSGSVDPAVGATVGLGNEAKVVIPENALKGTIQVTVAVQQVTSYPETPAGIKIAGKVYEFTVGGQSSYTFNGNVEITLSFDQSLLGPDETAAVFYYDQSQQQWVNLGGTVTGNTITVNVKHFTKFAVFAVKKPTTTVVTPVPGALNDIAGHWAEANIRNLVELGAVSGYPDGSFKPDNTITRAEFATIMVKAFKLDSSTDRLFKDTSSHWAKDYVSTAAVFGIVSGYDADTFRPDDLITREQMAVMIAKAAKLEVVDEESTFADRDGTSEWAKSAIVTAAKNGIMKGYADNTIQPLGNATRAEAVTVIVSALKLSE